MFMGLRSPLAEGQSVKVTLEFERAGRVELDFSVGNLGGRTAPANTTITDGRREAVRAAGGGHRPIWRLARSFMISSVPPPMALTFTSR
ncbi:hypothetical protein ACJ4V0_05960 [Phreatobacter sp. HK31-P]